jgi:hypothetical protein
MPQPQLNAYNRGVYRLVIAFVILAAAPARLLAQPSGAVDFGRDVQPILRDHCYSCHGPDLQMNGFRLDRRSDALRGGGQSNIGPGNAEGSRLYQRIAGAKLGARMPPTGALPDDQITIIKRWIDGGAHWPDELSGEVPEVASDPAAVALIDAIRAGAPASVSIESVLTKPGRKGMTPLMAAALYGDAAMVRRALAAGADPDARTASGLTALMFAVPDLERTRALLDAGADVNARSDEGRTALTIARASTGSAVTVRLLLDYGADPLPGRTADVSPLREAVRADDVETFRLLVDYGLGLRSTNAPPVAMIRTTCPACAAALGLGEPLPVRPPVSSAGATVPPDAAARPAPFLGNVPATAETIRAAIARSLPRLQRVDVDFVKHTGCVSCHHNSLVSLAVATARAHGYQVDEATTRSQNAAIGAYLESWRERALQGIPIAGAQDTMSYILWGLAAAGYVPDAATDAQAIWLQRRQGASGRWAVTTLRPPIESNDIEVTVMSMRALQLFAPPSRRPEFDRAVGRTRDWLATAIANSTEERAFRLLGLAWSGASPRQVESAADALLAAQRGDGGWSQEPAMASDAYATGEALYALRESGAAGADSPGVRKGVEYLLRTQYPDGTWFVESRSVPIQPYFESGFPYGAHQWISAAGTAWATAALALAR